MPKILVVLLALLGAWALGQYGPSPKAFVNYMSAEEGTEMTLQYYVLEERLKRAELDAEAIQRLANVLKGDGTSPSLQQLAEAVTTLGYEICDPQPVEETGTVQAQSDLKLTESDEPPTPEVAAETEEAVQVPEEGVTEADTETEPLMQGTKLIDENYLVEHKDGKMLLFQRIPKEDMPDGAAAYDYYPLFHKELFDANLYGLQDKNPRLAYLDILASQEKNHAALRNVINTGDWTKMQKEDLWIPIGNVSAYEVAQLYFSTRLPGHIIQA